MARWIHVHVTQQDKKGMESFLVFKLQEEDVEGLTPV